MPEATSFVYPLTMPARPGFREISWEMESVVGVTTSPFSLVQTVYAWPGQRFAATVRLPPMMPDLAREWIGFFHALNAQAGTFYLSDSKSLRLEEGADLGMPEVDGDHEAGSRVNSKEWPPNHVDLLKAGDLIEIAGRLRRVCFNTNSDGDGKAILHVWPHIAAMTDGTPIEWLNPRGIFRLTAAPPLAWGVAQLLEGITFGCVEALT
jgi:hypothetical protein